MLDFLNKFLHIDDKTSKFLAIEKKTILIAPAIVMLMAVLSTIAVVPYFNKSLWIVVINLVFVLSYSVSMFLYIKYGIIKPIKYLTTPIVLLHAIFVTVCMTPGDMASIYVFFFIPLASILTDRKLLMWSLITIPTLIALCFVFIYVQGVREYFFVVFSNTNGYMETNNYVFFLKAFTVVIILFFIFIIMIINEIKNKIYTKENIELTENINHLIEENYNIQAHAMAMLEDENQKLKIELKIARQVQEMVLPGMAEFAEIENFDIAVHYKSYKDVGGDYYDIFTTDKKTAILIGDVTDHDIEGMFIMLMIHSCVRALVEQGITMAETLLNNINTIMFRDLSRISSQKEVSMVAIIGNHKGDFHVSGQHESIVIIPANGCAPRIIDTTRLGFPIGTLPNIAPHLATIKFKLIENDILFLYTDGLIESKNPSGDEHPIKNAIDIIANNRHLKAEELRNMILEEFNLFLNGEEQIDDVTFLVLKKKSEQVDDI